MPSDYLHIWLVHCQDRHGYPVNVGVGVNKERKIVLIGPPVEAVSLGPDEANNYILNLVTALRTIHQSA